MQNFYALQTNPVICSVRINDFWKGAVFNKLAAAGESIQSTVRGTPVIVTEQTIREILEFGDQPSYPIEFPAEKVIPILKRMGYEGEGKYPPL